MKKLILAINILIIAFTAYGQGLKPVKIDSLVTVSIPAKHDIKDTLNQKILSGNGNLGYMIVIRAANHNQPLQKEKDLNNVFKEYMNKVQGQSSGSILNARDTTIGNLKAKVFALESNNESGSEIRDFVVIYTNPATYTFEYVYPIGRKDLVKEENKAFFGSINISSELQRTDQYTSTATSSSPNIGRIAIYGGGALVLLLIGYLIYKKKTEPIVS